LKLKVIIVYSGIFLGVRHKAIFDHKPRLVFAKLLTAKTGVRVSEYQSDKACLSKPFIVSITLP
jgi:hypothetical protein